MSAIASGPQTPPTQPRSSSARTGTSAISRISLSSSQPPLSTPTMEATSAQQAPSAPSESKLSALRVPTPPALAPPPVSPASTAKLVTQEPQPRLTNAQSDTTVPLVLPRTEQGPSRVQLVAQATSVLPQLTRKLYARLATISQLEARQHASYAQPGATVRQAGRLRRPRLRATQATSVRHQDSPTLPPACPAPTRKTQDRQSAWTVRPASTALRVKQRPTENSAWRATTAQLEARTFPTYAPPATFAQQASPPLRPAPQATTAQKKAWVL